MNFIKKTKEKLRELDNTHDKIVAKVYNTINEDYRDQARENAKRRLARSRIDKESEKDDGALTHFNPIRDWQNKKDSQFLQNTEESAEITRQKAIEAERTRARALNLRRIREADQKISTFNAERRYKAKKGKW